MAAPTNMYGLSPVNANRGTGKGSWTFSVVNTGETGDIYWIPPTSNNGIGVMISAPSTAAIKLQGTTGTIAEVKAGTAIWADITGATSTGGTAWMGGIAFSLTALRVNVTTGLAANTGYIAISASSSSGNG